MRHLREGRRLGLIAMPKCGAQSTTSKTTLAQLLAKSRQRLDVASAAKLEGSIGTKLARCTSNTPLHPDRPMLRYLRAFVLPGGFNVQEVVGSRLGDHVVER